MTSAEIKTILEEHSKWLENNKNGKCADLRWADLRWADLRKADLSEAKLRGANLSKADLGGANLKGADLSEANLSEANLERSDLRGANLSKADLGGADLRGANFSNANLINANLSNANSRGADLSNAMLNYPIACPAKGQFIGFKKAMNRIIKLEILSDAKRSSATSGKCRCDKARVVVIENIDGSESRIKEVSSNYDKEFIYRVGEIVFVDNFDENRWNECAPGIHFFITREEAVRY